MNNWTTTTKIIFYYYNIYIKYIIFHKIKILFNYFLNLKILINNNQQINKCESDKYINELKLK